MNTNIDKLFEQQITSQINKMRELQGILDTMIIPEKRKTNYEWLSKNIATKNCNHLKLSRAIELVNEFILMGITS